MKWEKPDAYHIRSGLFTVSKNFTGQGVIYMAYQSKEFIGRFESADAAKAACAGWRK
jgi:hypothetical protein